MKITEVQAFAVKIPRNAEELAGGAGVVATSGTTAVTGQYMRIGHYRPLFSSDIETMMVRIETDEGIVGWGEAQAPVLPEVPRFIVERYFRGLLLGADPMDSGVLWQRMYDSNRDRGQASGFMLDAMSAVDVALWDIKGKALGLPVYQLLGGAFHPEVPVYLSGLVAPSLAARVEVARTAEARGFRAFKVFLGGEFQDDLDEVTALRDALHPDSRIMVDAHWMYSRRTAQEIGLKYQELGVHWLEAPLIPEDLDGYRELAGMLRLQIAMGECERSPAQFANVLNSRAADILQPDVGRAGGITGVMRIAAMAAERQVNIAPHCGVGLGAYAAAGLHVAAAIPNLELLEYQPEMHACIDRLIHERFDVHDGHLSVPDRPGLGITYDEAELARYLDA